MGYGCLELLKVVSKSVSTGTLMQFFRSITCLCREVWRSGYKKKRLRFTFKFRTYFRVDQGPVKFKNTLDAEVTMCCVIMCCFFAILADILVFYSKLQNFINWLISNAVLLTR